MSDTLTLASTPAEPATGAVELAGQSSTAERLQEFIRRAATVDGGVLITAEEGSAVESLAREIHARGRHASRPFVGVDCADADVAQLDRALFGASPGEEASDLEAVTIDSLVAAARGGMLFLERVAELPAGAQARLARIARDGEVRIAGVPVETAFRLVASAAPGVGGDVETRRFRADLYRRLSAVRIDVPPLRERRDDIPAIAERLLVDICDGRAMRRCSFTQAALALLGAWSWPGNVRELESAIDRAVARFVEAGTPGSGGGDAIPIELVLPALHLLRDSNAFEPAGSLREARLRFEREYIAAVLQHHEWDMADAAQTLGIQRPNLYRKARQLGIPLARVTE